jgi:hypothetical protein
VIAVVDEAMVNRGQTAYILATVVLADERRTAVRAAAQRLVPRRRRFHFHQEEDREKRAMMELIAAQAADAHALVMSPCPLRERESVRQALLTELATVVSRQPAVELTIESRDSHNDRLDRASLIRARHAGAITDDTSLHDLTYLRRLPEGLLKLRQVSDLTELGERRR